MGFPWAEAVVRSVQAATTAAMGLMSFILFGTSQDESVNSWISLVLT